MTLIVRFSGRLKVLRNVYDAVQCIWESLQLLKLITCPFLYSAIPYLKFLEHLKFATASKESMPNLHTVPANAYM